MTGGGIRQECYPASIQRARSNAVKKEKGVAVSKKEKKKKKHSDKRRKIQETDQVNAHLPNGGGKGSKGGNRSCEPCFLPA